MKYSFKKTSNPLTFGLSIAAGGGLILMMLTLAAGVIQGEAANSSLISLTFAGGLVLFLTGFIGWLVVVRPFAHFDDIDVPKDTDHGHGHEEHAIVQHDQGEIEAAHEAAHH